ncbi:structural maintenance of chromosomes protein 3 homolog [Teleopsis dalmanni]|uniref:structural maintenance of chromosomes protein 3 homolog n=1 Tax=Teleopsis dalmanni TaxID=139649 RepID=UPI0018CC9F97|nr:structural maintenance of chromosomes protein 3 homolog [Teleopsis dalmanni]
MAEANGNTEDVNNNKEIVDDQQRDLLDMVFTLESEKQALVEESRKRIGALRKDLEESLSENEKLKRKVTQLEQSLKQSVMLGGNGAEGPKSRQEQDEHLLKCKLLLFEKTKENKHQEQQIGTLKNQVDAVKEVVQVTKDMLNLKNAECEHMQTRLEKAQLWIKAEKDKCAIIEKKLEISKNVYDKLRSEYDIQSKIFKELKETYEQKISILSNALEQTKNK